MKLTATLLLLLTMAARAADIHPYFISWTNSATVGASNKVYVARHPFQGNPITNSLFSVNIGTTNSARVSLSVGLWRVGVTAVVAGIESDPTAITIDVPSGHIVPEPVTGLSGRQ